MPKKFFNAIGDKTRLEQNIQKCITLFAQLEPEDPECITRLRTIWKRLQSLTQLAEYSTIKPAIKRTVTLNLKRIIEKCINDKFN